MNGRASGRNLWVGIGCQRGVSPLTIERAIDWVCERYDLDLATIAGMATVDRKAGEAGLVEYCRASQLRLKTYCPQHLNTVPVAYSSSLVLSSIGTASVAEAAALAAAESGILLVPRQKFQLDLWVTLAVAIAADRH